MQKDAEDAVRCCFRYTKDTITALVAESRERQQTHATLAEFDLNGPEPNERRDMPSSSSTTHMERRDAGGGEPRAHSCTMSADETQNDLDVQRTTERVRHEQTSSTRVKWPTLEQSEALVCKASTM